MNILENKELQYDSCQEKNFNPGLTSKEYKKLGIRYSILFFLLAHATLTSSYLPPTVTTLLVMFDDGNSKKQLPPKLPYYSWMPFNYDTPGSYLIALGYQAIPMFSYAYRACEDLENIHKYLTLAQVTATLFILCSCLYLVSTADKLSFYIWQCDWLTADNDFKKSMILTMARAKRPLYMTAGNFAPLTLPTFVSIIKGSYSFFAVIKNTSD
ncbi:hypothetical protein NQ314_020099 [Rhamnusium bicolor]|uniref:Uncharacterized protein n=1 Tax=Rhamnusium bicolor TaxID=1586634 RepID=A0AAV8WL06_9CUCU|nr:hypothetical protein NQ314_020099 [Rhamnusium bicolor]